MQACMHVLILNIYVIYICVPVVQLVVNLQRLFQRSLIILMYDDNTFHVHIMLSSYGSMLSALMCAVCFRL